MKCSVCAGALHRQNKIGICRDCYRTNRPDHIRKKQSDAVKRVYATRPEYRDMHRKAMRAHAQSPEHRQRASDRAKTMRIWEIGHRAITPEIAKKRAARAVSTRLSYVPTGYIGLYRTLRKKHLSVAEATAACLQQERVDLERLRREMGA
jgi:hypothetical protein